MPLTGSFFGSYFGPMSSESATGYLGKLAEPDGYDLRIKIAVSVSGTQPHPTGTVNGFGQAHVRYAPDFLNYLTAIRVRSEHIRYDATATVDRELAVEIPAFGISHVVNDHVGMSANLTVILNNVQPWINDSGRFLVTCDSVDISGDITATYMGPWEIVSPRQPAPSAMPVWAVPMHVTGGCGANPQPAIPLGWLPAGHTAGGTANVSSSCVAAQEYRIHGTSTWQSWPVAISPGNGAGTCSGTTSAAITVNGESYYDDQTTSLTIRRESGEVWAWPNWSGASEHVRLNDGFRELIARQGAPQVDQVTSTNYTEFDSAGDGTPVVTNTVATIYNQATSGLFEAEDTRGIWETWLDSTRYAPCRTDSYEEIITTSSHVLDNLNDEFGSVQSNFAYTPTALTHITAWEPTLYDTWYAGLWLYSPWYPGSTGHQWQIDGADSDVEYWLANRQQHCEHPSLPSGGTKKRTNVLGSPLDQNTHTGLWQSMFGFYSPWGVSCLFAQTLGGYASSFTLDDRTATRWTFPSGTGSVSATEVTIDAGTVEARFDLSSFGTWPYNVSAIIDRLQMSGLGTNISGLSAYLVGVDGTEALIGSTSATHRLPKSTSTKWLVDHEIEFSGLTLPDTYTRVAAAGSDISAATFASNSRAANTETLTTRQGSYIKFVVTPVDTGLAAKFTLPTLHMAPMVAVSGPFWETAPYAQLLFADGPAVSYGHQSYWNPLSDALLVSPIIDNPVGRLRTMGDWLCWRRNYLEGRLSLDAIGAELSSLGLTGREWTIEKHAWREPSGGIVTHSFLVKGASDVPCAIMVWSRRHAIPAIPQFPTRKRTKAANWGFAGAYGMWAYVAASDRMHFCGPDSVSLKNGGGELLDSVTAPSGYAVGYFDNATDGSEGYDWTFAVNGVELAKVRPWRGGFGIPLVIAAGGNLSYDVDFSSAYHVLVEIIDGTAQASLAGNDLSFTDPIDTGIAADWACVAIDKASSMQEVYLAVASGGTATIYKSARDCGAFTSTGITMATEKPLIFIGRDGVRHIYWPDGTDVKGEIRDRAGSVVEPEFTATTGIDDGTAVSGATSVIGQGEKRVVLICIKSGTRTILTSADGGKTFS